MANGKNNGKSKRNRRPRNQIPNPASQVVIPRAPSVFKLSRLHDLGTLAPVTTDYGYALAANLNVLPNLSELSSLFQEYRLTYAAYDLVFIPAATERYTPTVWYANYVADIPATTPAGLTDVAEISGVRRFSFGPDKRLLRIGFKPRTRTSETLTLLRTSPWITMSTTNVNHGGLRLWFQDFNTSEALGARLRLTLTLSVEMRGTR